MSSKRPSQPRRTGEKSSRLDQLWAKYKAEGDPAAREELIMAYAPLVRRVVERMGIPPTNSIDEEDLIGYGILGLIEAVERFEPERGYRFETYAVKRIRGSILDALRVLDPLPRSARQRISQVRDAVEHLQQQFGRMPTDEEILSYTGMGQDAYEQALTEAGFAILSLDAPLALSDDGQETALSDVLCGPDGAELQSEIEEEELREELKEAIKRLPQREQILLSLYYYEGLTMREIGQVLGLSQARVCQLHAKAILALRASLQAVYRGAIGGKSHVRAMEPAS